MTPIQSMRGYMVFDNFVRDPESVRKSVLVAGVGTWRPNKGEVGSSIYDGMSFWGDHSGLVRALAQACGQPVYPNSMFFRVTNTSTEGAYVHSDREAGEFTAIVYLSKHDEGTSGTGFYQHRDSGRILMDSFEEMGKDPEAFERLKKEMVAGSEEHWKQIQFVPGVYTRALIFDARLFHARIPKHGFGETADDGRMVWACHFNT